MLFNLYGYVEASLKYILVFKNEQDKDFLIFENPADIGMSGLLNAHERDKMMQSLPHEIRSTCFLGRDTVNKSFDYDDSTYHSHIAGIKRISYGTYHDVIKENPDIKFVVINVPISILLYQKIMKLSQNSSFDKDVPTFDTDEICALVKYLSLFDEYGRGAIACAVCMHLLNNPELLQEMKNYNHDPNNGQYNESTMLLSKYIFGSSDIATQLRKSIKSYVILALKDKDKNRASISGKSKFYGYHYRTVNSHKFTLAFLFYKLDMNYKWLLNNKEILDSEFNVSNSDSPYTVSIYGLKSHGDLENETLKRTLEAVTTSKFLTGTNVDSLTLEFNSIHTNVDLSCLNNIKAPITVVCNRCSLNFIQSIPEHVKVAVYTEENIPNDAFNNIFKNVVKFEFLSLEIRENIVFPDHVESIEIDNCNVNKDVTLMINGKCEYVEIYNTPVKIVLPCVMGSGIMLRHLCFEYNVDKEQKSLKLQVADINSTVTIDATIDAVRFEDVNVSAGSCVIFSEENKNLKILHSTGMFNLKQFIGIEQCFNKGMRMEVAPIIHSTHNLSKIALYDFRFVKRVELPNKYEEIELDHVLTDENVEIVLNKACRKLVIRGCRVVINAQNVDELDSLCIQFSALEKDNIVFVGLKRVNHISLIDICHSMDVITTILAGLEGVKHLEFESKYPKKMSKVFEEYNKESLMNIVSTENYINDLNFELRYSAIKDKEPVLFLFEMSNIVVNLILKAVLSEKVMNTVSKLEFTSVVIDADNCKSLGKLSNLEILRICPEIITNEFFYNLPMNLKLLNITDLDTMDRSLMTEHEINPLNLARPNISLKVLVIDAQFLYDFNSILLLIPSLEVLKIRYSEPIKINSQAQRDKIRLHELFIECSYSQINEYKTSSTKSEIHCFIQSLALYIDFTLLERLGLVSISRPVFINAATLMVIE
ncbi:hypothetical protein VCUG_00621 [Vavraia culicis subsp. floridensis]|uniref:Uncharacterized protein n=1 Tax=Vavraia culicis (isolate floridensis) TaxID=948595 RepID=L2GW69_VAVCU|nr:uncharacterized protein VCUG_00621 [Vavraia culicis subsp. floridensis]ELA47901.1 hypothetical protein VCUG_00621 [Vavraia culicis subsp. floridensis]